MHPVLFYIGPFPVFSYGVCVVLGLLTLFSIGLTLARQAGWEWNHLAFSAFGMIAGGVFGARLSHLIVEPDKLVALLDFYSLFGPVTPGNIVGMMAGAYVGGLVVRRSLGRPSPGNYYAPAIAAASMVWRIGCTLGGCCYGKETNLPWAIHLAGADRHPTMVYEGLFNLVMLVVLWRLRHRITRENVLLHLYLAAYAFFRFWLEFIRLYPPVAFGLTGIQYICLGILLWLAIWLWRQRAGQGTTLPAGGATA